MNNLRSAIKHPIRDLGFPALPHGFMAVAITSFFLNVLLLTGPLYMLQIYDRVLSSQSLPTLVALSLLVGALFLIYGLLDFARRRLMARVSSLFDLGLAEDSFEASLSHRTSQASPQDPLKDLRCVQQFLMSPAATNLFDIPWFPIYLLAIYFLHPALSVVALGGAFVLIAIAAVSASVSREPERKTLNYSANEDELVSACKQNHDAIYSMGMLPSVAMQWQKGHGDLIAATRHSCDKNAPLAAASRTVRLLVQSAILGFGAYLVIGSSLSAGSLIAASIMFGRALAPMDSTIGSWRSIVAAYNSWMRLRTGVRLKGQSTGEVKLQKPTTSLSTSNLAVGINGQKKPIVRNVSFDLQAGDGLAIIGPSGGGKTSLLRGLLGILPCYSGSMRLDGATLEQWDHAQRGEIVGYLPQSVQLFPGTIGENICRLKEEVDSDAVQEAAKLCGAHELITRLPEGYNTLVGHGGHQLSAGQVQRIGLARAVFGMPFLVILDEPNAHLDAQGENLLNTTIRALRAKGSIAIVAAHRKSALSETNKALLIADGEMKLFGERDNVLKSLESGKPKQKGGLRVVGNRS